MRVLALSFTCASLAVPVALAADAINTATLTCKDLMTSSHKDMVAMDEAIYEALKGDPKFSSFSPAAMVSAEEKACAKHPDAKVIDALREDN